MTIINRTLVSSKYIESSQTTQYTSTGLTSIIDSAVVTNTTGSAITFSINLVTSGGAVGGDNRFVSSKILQGGESYRCPEITGQVLQNGDLISAIASSVNSISLRISGRQIS